MVIELELDQGFSDRDFDFLRKNEDSTDWKEEGGSVSIVVVGVGSVAIVVAGVGSGDAVVAIVVCWVIGGDAK